MLRREFVGGLIAGGIGAAATSRVTNLTADGAVNNPYGLRIGPDGALYICEIGNHRVSRLDLKTLKLTAVADGQKEPYELQFDPDSGDLIFVDMPAHIVRRLNRRTGELTTIAGTGVPGFSGDGGPAVEAQFKQPHSIAFQPDGRLLVCDIGNHRIRRIDLKKGTIDTFAGTGEKGFTEDGSPLTGTPLNGPRALDFGRDGDLYLVLREGNVVLRLHQGRFHRVATLNGPKGISCAAGGNVYIADTESHLVRQIDQTGMLSTIAGTGTRGGEFSGDPLKCGLARPHGVFASEGAIYIGDSENHRVLLVKE